MIISINKYKTDSNYFSSIAESNLKIFTSSLDSRRISCELYCNK